MGVNLGRRDNTAAGKGKTSQILVRAINVRRVKDSMVIRGFDLENTPKRLEVDSIKSC